MFPRLTSNRFVNLSKWYQNESKMWNSKFSRINIDITLYSISYVIQNIPIKYEYTYNDKINVLYSTYRIKALKANRTKREKKKEKLLTINKTFLEKCMSYRINHLLMSTAGFSIHEVDICIDVDERF